MATTPTTNKSKNKKPLPVKLEDDSILGAPIQDEILKRIGEQAKDWEETPRPPRREPGPAASTRNAKRTAAPGLPRWTLAPLAILILALGGGIAWLNGRTVALEHSLAGSNATIRGLNDKLADLQKAQTETQTQLQSMSDALAAAASVRAAARPVAKPALTPGAAAAQNSAVKTNSK